MTVTTADFEAGVNSATIATGDAGSATAWNTIVSTPNYDNTQKAHGNLAAHFNVTNAAMYAGWQAALGTIQSPFYGRFYVRFATFPGTFNSFFAAANTSYTTSGGQAFDLDFSASSGGSMRVVVGGNTAAAYTFTTTLTANQWWRIEYLVVPSATVGQVQVKLYSSLDSITVTEDSGLKTGLNTLASIDRVSYGNVRGASGNWSVWFDNIVANATGFPGPYPVNTTAPTVSGSAGAGSVLTAGNGTWNSGATFNYTYQWTRAGSNIGGATSATYTTVSADIGNAIGCTVTATGQQATNESATTASSNTVTVTASTPANTVAPVASGSATIGSTVSTTDGTWTGIPAPTFTYQWQRDVLGNGSYSNIGSATANTYVLVTADDGCNVRCTVTGTNSAGSASANSNSILDTTSAFTPARNTDTAVVYAAHISQN